MDTQQTGQEAQAQPARVPVQAEFQRASDTVKALRSAYARVIVGQQDLLESILVTMISRGFPKRSAARSSYILQRRWMYRVALNWVA